MQRDQTLFEKWRQDQSRNKKVLRIQEEADFNMFKEILESGSGEYENIRLDITHLDLSYFHFEPDKLKFDKLVNLKKLNLKNTNLKTLPEGVAKLTRLEELDCRNTEIDSDTLPPQLKSKKYNLYEENGFKIVKKSYRLVGVFSALVGIAFVYNAVSYYVYEKFLLNLGSPDELTIINFVLLGGIGIIAMILFVNHFVKLAGSNSGAKTENGLHDSHCIPGKTLKLDLSLTGDPSVNKAGASVNKAGASVNEAGAGERGIGK